MVNRNKILGEESNEEDHEDDEDVEDDANENEHPKKTFTPQYVNIRRQRPSTTEGPSTSKYTEIRRSTTDSNQEESSADDPYSK